jgi:hypothetical protein
MTSPGSCVPNSSNTYYPNMYYLTSIDRTTIVEMGYLKSAIFGGTLYESNGTALSSILFKSGNFLDFDSLTTSSAVTFNLFNIGFNHYKVFVRFNAKTSCVNAADTAITLTVAGTSKSFTATNTATVFESNLITHTLGTLTVTIQFGVIAQSCYKLIQDISVYL